MEVILSLTAKQTNPGCEPEVIELITKGTLERIENGWQICYKETDLTGLAGVTTKFRLEGDQVTLNRSGKLNSQMVFREGSSHNSLYEMEFGALMISVSAKLVRYDITENGGTVDLVYTIEIEQTDGGTIEYHLELNKENR